jgi:hypothetical protein
MACDVLQRLACRSPLKKVTKPVKHIIVHFLIGVADDEGAILT